MNEEKRNKKKAVMWNFLVNSSVLFLWVFMVVYFETVVPFEQLGLRYLLPLLGLSTSLFGFIDLLVDLSVDSYSEYAKSVLYNSEKQLKKADKMNFLLLIGAIVALFLAKIYSMPWLKHLLWPYLGRSYDKVPLNQLRDLKYVFYDGWYYLVALYTCLYLLVRLKIYVFTALDISIHRRLELGYNHLISEHDLKDEELLYKKQFERDTTLIKRMGYLVFCAAYVYGGTLSFAYLYYPQTPDLLWFMVCYLTFVTGIFLGWLYYLRTVKPEVYDYSFLKGFSLITIVKDLKKIWGNGWTAVKKLFTRNYEHYDEEVSLPLLLTCIILCLNLHAPVNLCFKLVYELHYIRRTFSALTLSEIFTPAKFYQTLLGQRKVYMTVLGWILLFQAIKYVKDCFIAPESDKSTFGDLAVYFISLWSITGYYTALQYSLYLTGLMEIYGPSLSVMRSLFLAITFYYRLGVYRLYLRSVVNKKSAQLIANIGVIFALITLTLRRIIPVYPYLLGSVSLMTCLSLYTIRRIYYLRKKNNFKPLDLDIVNLEQNVKKIRAITT